MSLKEDIEREIVKRIVDAVGIDLVSEIKMQITEKGITNTGGLVQSVRYDVENMEVIVGKYYAGFLEYGTKPRKKYPPFDAIDMWTRLKLGIKSKREREAVTWKIMWKIKLKGTQPRYYVRDAINKVVDMYNGAIRIE